MKKTILVAPTVMTARTYNGVKVEVLPSTINSVTRYYVVIDDVGRPFDHIWDMMEALHPDNEACGGEITIGDVPLRRALEDIGAVETDGDETCTAGEDYETFCATISELRDVALDNDPMVLPTHELKPPMPGDPKFEGVSKADYGCLKPHQQKFLDTWG